MKYKKTQIFIISVGPGNKKYLTMEAIDKINSVDVLTGSKRLKNLAKERDYIILNDIVNDAFTVIEKNDNKTVGILVSGDAGFFSLERALIEKFGKNKVEVIPGISIIQAAFATLKESWSDISVYSFHGKDSIQCNLECANGKKIVILCENFMAIKNFFYSNADIFEHYYIYIFQNYSLEDEAIIDVKNFYDLDNFQEGKLTTIIIMPKRKV